MPFMIRPTEELLHLCSAVSLAPHERDRAAALPEGPRRNDYLAAHILIRICAARLTGLSPRSVRVLQSCAHCGGDDHGRPYLPNRLELTVSYSYSAGIVAAAADSVPIGVDVECVTGRFDRDVARRILSGTELAEVEAAKHPEPAFLRWWVRKEALVKVGATRLADRITARSLDGWHLKEHTGPGGRYLAAVVTPRPRTPRTTDLPRS